jgi:hypothetical protein
MSDPSTSFVLAARRMAASLRKETELARLGALGDLSAAAEAKKIALQEFTEACAARGRTPPGNDAERAELRQLLDEADENSIILEAVSSTLRELAKQVRAAAATIADPGTYTLPGRAPTASNRHVLAACVNASI